MFNRLPTFALFSCFVLTCGIAHSQSLCLAGVQSDKLICLIPQVYGVNGLAVKNPAAQGNFGVNFLTNGLSAFESAVARQSALTPIASPSSGITFSWDPEAKIFVPSTDSLGPIASERAETIGKHKVYLGYDYQFLAFSSLDGQDLRRLPIALPQEDFLLNGTICSINGTTAQNTGDCGFIRDVVTTQNRLDLKIQQVTTFFTFGLTNRIDLSAAIPIEHIRMSLSSNVTVSHNDSPSRFFHAFAARLPDCPAICLNQSFSNPGTASGIGDITLRIKAAAWKGERAGLALGVDVRLPTGDALNYLGAGAAGGKPFVVWSYRARVSPHVFTGYETNGSAVTAGDISTGKKDKLPGQLTYAGGVDVFVNKRFTLVADIVGQQVFQARRTVSATFVEPGQCQDSQAATCDPNLPFLTPKRDMTLAQATGTFNITNLAVGFKAKVFSTLLVTGNASVKLNDSGLRATVVPLVGLSYTF